LTKSPITVEKLLALYWLNSENEVASPENTAENLRRFSESRGLEASDLVLEKATEHLNGALSKGDVGQWVVSICFFAHPHTLWNFMLDAVEVAENDDHLGGIAASLAEHMLAYYGSMLPHFEAQARHDSRFKRMLTGVRRHIMSDRVWMRLRALQSGVPDPLSEMIPLENGVDYMADTLKPEYRENDDKGQYVRGADGQWHKPPASENKRAERSKRRRSDG
jgi:hypothetical protein